MDNLNSEDLLFTVIAVTLLFLILTVFIVTFTILYIRKKKQHFFEKATLRAQYEAEILTSSNEIQEQTMKDISRELHDNVGQMLTLVKIQLNNLSEESPENKRITDSKEFLQTALTDIRSLSKTLNNDNVLAEGLPKAIAFVLARLEKTGIIKTQFKDNYQGQILDHKKEIIVFRIFQELIQNILKHAQAKNIEVNLEETAELLNLELIDDGIGFDFESKKSEKGFSTGSGLGNLIHRAELLGGKLEFLKINEKGGTRSKLTIPKGIV